jgi:DNA replication ATP-dependent helicase Dna2
MNTPLPRKHNKRARSSSPVAPSQDDHMLDAVKKDLTTPQADPAMELWSRYTSNKGTPSANKSVAFAHLINESSPRSSVAAGSVSGLRRWASCGHEFPASTRKRRRTNGVFQGEKDQTEDVFAAAPSSDGVMLGQPPKSKVASMVERMKESVSKPSRICSQLPSSSSPLPDAGDRHMPSSGSPLQRRAHEQDVESPERMQEEDDFVEDDAQIEDDEPQRCSASSDDFGDEDFDADMVDALGISRNAALEQPVQADSPATYLAIPAEPSNPPLQHDLHEEAQANDAESDDEFGMDEDEDGFAADLEQVASLYDTRPIANVSQEEFGVVDLVVANITGATAPVPVIDLVDDSDDEFGDEIDVDVFAAAEVAATQPSANSVRRTSTIP